MFCQLSLPTDWFVGKLDWLFIRSKHAKRCLSDLSNNFYSKLWTHALDMKPWLSFYSKVANTWNHALINHGFTSYSLGCRRIINSNLWMLALQMKSCKWNLLFILGHVYAWEHTLWTCGILTTFTLLKSLSVIFVNTSFLHIKLSGLTFYSKL